MIVFPETRSLGDRKIHKQTYVLNSLKNTSLATAVSGRGDKISSRQANNQSEFDPSQG